MKTPKILLLSSLIVLAACSDNHKKEARDYYEHTYWPLTTVLEAAIKNFDNNTEVPLKDQQHCAHQIAQEMNKDRAIMKELFNESEDKIVAVIQESYTEEELAKINDFYETKGGKRFASLEEFNKTLLMLQQSEYKDEVEAITKDPNIPSERRFSLVAEITLKALPQEERDGIKAFEESETGQKMKNTQIELAEKISDALKPFSTKTQELNKYVPQIAEACKDEIAKKQAEAQAAQEATKKEAPKK